MYFFQTLLSQSCASVIVVHKHCVNRSRIDIVIGVERAITVVSEDMWCFIVVVFSFLYESSTNERLDHLHRAAL